MKRFVFGCVLLVSGILGGTGWVLARAIMASTLGWVDLYHLVHFDIGDWGLERFFIFAFYLIAIIGAVIAIKSFKEEK